MTPAVALRRVTMLFWITGASAAGHVAVVFLTQGHLSLDLGLWGLWIGPGLRDHRQQAWRHGHYCAFLTFAVTALFGLAVAGRWISLADIEFYPFGVPIREPSFLTGLAFFVITLAISGWQLLTLQRDDVRDLFSDAPGIDPSPGTTS